MNIKTTAENVVNYKKYLRVEQLTRQYLDNKNYLSVDLPVLSPTLIPESYLEVFKTEFLYQKERDNLFLTPSPELFLKRLLVHNIGNCYYLGKAFRNADPPTSLHSFEFTMLEFYKVSADYMDIAEEVLSLLRYIAKDLFHSVKITYQGKTVDLSKWEKYTVAQAFKKFAGIDESIFFDHLLFLDKAREKGYKTSGFSYEDIFSQVYTAEVEPHLGMNGYPTLLYDYPIEFAALAKSKNKLVAERFEFYIGGVELGDCYTELTDSEEQNKRFIAEDELRCKTKKVLHPVDKGFIEALQYGLGPCAGIAIGFERLAMIFADVDSIDKLKLINVEI